MENIRRHLAFTGQTSKGPTSAERSSVFHVEVKQEVDRSCLSDSVRSDVPNRPASQGTAESVQQLLAGFVQCLSKYHSSGTQLRQELGHTLKGTLYQPLGAMCTTKLPHNIFDRRPDFLQLANDIHALLTGLQEKMPKTEASQQAVLKCMLLLLKLESQYHELCLQEMQTTLRELAQSCASHSCHDVLQLMASLGLANQGSPNRNLGKSVGQYSALSDKATPHTQGSHDDLLSIKENGSIELEETAKLPPKQGSKSSIFSLFGRKNSPEDGKNNASSFYVDIKSDKQPADSKFCVQSNMSNQQLHVDTGSGLSLSVTPPPSDGNTKTALPSDRLGIIGSKSKASRNSQLASEEELDSVINLLSGCGASNSSNSSSRASPQMQSIPENKVASPRLELPRDHHPHHHHGTPRGLSPTPASTNSSSGGGPVVTHIPITVTREPDSLKPPSRAQQHHRRSEGSIDFTNSDFYGRNTWPHQHRTSLPNGPPGVPPQGLYDHLSQEQQQIGRRYSSDLQARPRGYYGNQLLAYPQWTFPESKLQTWQTLSSHTSSQASGLATAGSDTMNSSWSGFQDSSDLSDDSSSGEQFFAVGLDLVNALDSKNDSSDEEFEQRAFLRDAKEQRPRSLENLLDVKSNYTWPPKQPWARSALVISEAMEASVHDNAHRPLQMQWSDPMSSRNVWGAAGLGPQLQHRAMHDFGPLPH